MGWEAALPCVSKEAKLAKIVSLIEKVFCAHPLKDVSIFASFACPAVSGASRWAGQSAKSSGFCLKKVRISSKTRSHKKITSQVSWLFFCGSRINSPSYT